MQDNTGSQNPIEVVAKWLNESQQIVVFTGAGVSKESGIPTFRDALEGLWAKYDPQQLATRQAFANNPQLVWDFYEYRRGLVRQAKPNAGHEAIARLSQLKPYTTLITQNVDDLHEQAGKSNIIHLHGSIFANKCSVDCLGEPTTVELERVPIAEIPLCPHCGEFLRPDVVWFGERLPEHAWVDAVSTAGQANCFMIVGTSGVVSPASHIPRLAKEIGAKVIEVNPYRSELTDLADVWIDQASARALPQIITAMEKLTYVD